MTKDEVATWLDTNYPRLDAAERACILANEEELDFITTRADQFAGAQFESGPEAYQEGLGFALSSLVEAHRGPHTEDCPVLAYERKWELT